MRRVHIVGAGLAGLAAAVRLSAAKGWAVTIHESAGQAGGRCRSYFDELLGCSIDNGNHLLLSGNRSARAYLDEIGAADTLYMAPEAIFPFMDLRDGSRWSVRLGRGRLPWWIFSAARRVPGTRPLDYLAGLTLAFASSKATVAECLGGRVGHGAAYERFWKPLTVAALSTAPEEGSARLLFAVLRETFGRGGEATRPCIAKDGLSATFVDPALRRLGERGVEVGFNRRVRALAIAEGRVTGLESGEIKHAIGADDAVLLALPPQRVAELLPGIDVPEASNAIVNAHFRLERAPLFPHGLPFLGLIGGVAEWLFLRGEIVSVTVSAADALAEQSNEAIAERLWADAARALALPEAPRPPTRIVKEKRATIAQTPAAVAKRAKTRTPVANLYLAGDWTDTGIPATIESAVRSGHAAAATIAGV